MTSRFASSWILLAIGALASCSYEQARGDPHQQVGSEPQGRPPVERPEPADVQRSTSTSPSRDEDAEARLTAISTAVSRWQAAGTLSEARRHAEAARNLIVGPTGPGYGDADGDGTVSGSNSVGLLPGAAGGPALAIPPANACVTRDLLGGSWDNPARRWAILQQKIEAWRPGNNTFPTLPSHAQRIVGWATLALTAEDVRTARDYAGHARIHVDVAHKTLTDCRS